MGRKLKCNAAEEVEKNGRNWVGVASDSIVRPRLAYRRIWGGNADDEGKRRNQNNRLNIL